MNNYTALHCHSEFSLLDGISKIGDIVKRCKFLGMNSIAISDHGSLSSCVKFSDTLQKENIKPILGIELYTCPDLAIKDRNLEHLVVLAKNLQGWKQLIKLVSESNKPENFYYKPRLDLPTLSKFLDGNIIGFSGHLGSHLSNVLFKEGANPYNLENQNEIRELLKNDWLEQGANKASELETLFGVGNFFIEIQLIDRKTLKSVDVVVEKLREISKQTGIKCIATPDAHYCEREDAIDQRVVLCTNMNTTLKDVYTKLSYGEDVGLATFFKSNNYHIPSYDDMVEVGCTEEELSNTNLIADLCEIYKITRNPQLPQYTTPNGQSSEDYLRELCRAGYKNKIWEITQTIKELGINKEEYGKRFEHELKILTEAKLGDYFLIVKDIIDYAKNQGQLIGCGRGSASGSLILYLLGVTQIDPIKYNLLFARFFNYGRLSKDHISLPDVDMDFEMQHREDIIQFIKDRFGHDKVAQIITFSRMQGRSALKDVLRVNSTCTFSEMNQITSYVPDEAEIADELQEMRENSEDGEASIVMWALENRAEQLKQWCYLDENHQCQGPLSKRFEQAIRLEGTKRSTGKHAAGVVISGESLSDICPMVYDKKGKEILVGVDMVGAESLGLTKFDILSIGALDKIHIIQNLVNNEVLHP